MHVEQHRPPLQRGNSITANNVVVEHLLFVMWMKMDNIQLRKIKRCLRMIWLRNWQQLRSQKGLRVVVQLLQRLKIFI